MWPDNATSVYVVLGIGNFLGGVTKGITGFGSAILNLCTWIAFVVCGVDSGTLQQAVVCEALSSTLIAPGLLYVTRAHATADLKMVAALSLFVALSSPVGAVILAKLDSQRVQLVMGATLLLVIVVEQLAKLAGRCSSSSSSPSHSSTSDSSRLVNVSAAAEAAVATAECHSQADAEAPDLLPGSDQQQLAATDGGSSGDGGGGRGGQPAVLAAAAAADCTVCVLQADSCNLQRAASDSRSVSTNSSSSSSSRDNIVVLVSDDSIDATAAADGDDLQQPLLADNSSSSASKRRDKAKAAAATCFFGNSSSRQLVQPLAPVPANDSSTTTNNNDSSSSSSSSGRQSALKAWAVIFGIGSIAGTLSGIMEGLTGANGPPIMFMYRRLNTPKATVRGNNAFLNLLQMRLVSYWYMGLMTAADLQLYGVACAAGVVGVWLGDRLSYLINQQAFQQVLAVLMALCCFLMFGSGLGLIA